MSLRAVGRVNVVAFRAISRRNASTSTPAVANIETRWKSLSAAEQNTITKQLEEVQKKEWGKLSLEEKKAAYWIAFGPHGPREPVNKPGHAVKVISGITIAMVISAGLFYYTRNTAIETPRTINKEWEEATNEYLKAQKSNPISGISSEGYKGKGYVASA